MQSLPGKLGLPGPIQIILDQGDINYFVNRSVEMLRGEYDVDTLTNVITLLAIAKLRLLTRIEESQNGKVEDTSTSG